MYLSGYISIEHLTSDATCYLKNVNFITGGAGTCGIYYYVDKSVRDYQQEYGSIDGAVYDSNGVLTQFTIKGGYYKWFRIASCGFDSTSIITINEPIE